MTWRVWLLLVCLAVPGLAQSPASGIIRVGIVLKAATVHLSCDGDAALADRAAASPADLPTGRDLLVTPAQDGGIVLAGTRYGSPLRITPRGSALIRVNGKQYHDAIIIRARAGTLTVVNEVNLENYLRGILPREANPAWAAESLKAQAVVSRTYVLRNMGRHESEGYDVCSTVHCQVYGGADCEDPRSDAAVADTGGQVLLFDGALAQTVFHASCGGHTEHPRYVWSGHDTAPSYLHGRKDKYCGDSPHHHWKNTVAEKTIRAGLVKAGYDVGTISRIRVAGTSPSGRATELRIDHAKGVLHVHAGRFRLAVSPWTIRSTMFEKIRSVDDGFEFSGLGWGHGVGMCQWGAKVMAERGKDYEAILSYYYPGTTVKNAGER